MFPTKADVHGIKRQEVLREAAASFNFKGYHGTSLTEIATSLGVTKAALYHYFPNKNSLLAACFEQAMDVAFASLERGRKQGKNGRDRLVLTIAGYVSHLVDELNCGVGLMEEQALEPGDRTKLVRQRDRFERHRQLRAPIFVFAVMTDDHVLDFGCERFGERLTGEPLCLLHFIIKHRDAEDHVAE